MAASGRCWPTAASFACEESHHTQTCSDREDARGRWGVALGCNSRSILVAIATLIEAQRPDLAVVLIEKELNSQT